MSTTIDETNGTWTECWQCAGVGQLAGCFEDTCSCMGDPEDPEDCCSPRRCDICKGKGGYVVPLAARLASPEKPNE